MTTPVPPHLSDEEREGAAVCGVDCRPGDGLCNGYCHDNRVKAPPAIRLAPPLDRALDQLTRGAEGNGANLGAVECLSLLTALSTEREAGERLLDALAKRCLADMNAAREDPNDWPAGQEWDELVGSSQSIFRRRAREEAGITAPSTETPHA